jgi:hypothetical protein
MLTVLRFDKKINGDAVGVVTVRYYDLIMNCQVVIYRSQKLWVRMPERWVNGRKFPYVKWLDVQASDHFQNFVIKKLFDKYNFDLDAALLIKKKRKKPGI